MPIHALAKLRSNLGISERELKDFAAALGIPRILRAGEEIVGQGEQSDFCAVLLTGFASRQRLLTNGDIQILSFVIPGDMCDLPSLLLKPIDHSICTLSDCSVAYISHAAIRKLIADHPCLGYAFWHETLIDGAIFREWVANLGSRSAYARVAHVLCELKVRLETVGLVSGHQFDLPVTQRGLGQATGLSAVHINRTLQRLKREGIVTINGKSVSIEDWQQLTLVGDFDDGYLYNKGRVAA